VLPSAVVGGRRRRLYFATLPRMSWVTGEPLSRDAVLALQPAAVERARELEALLHDGERLDPGLVNLVRARVDYILAVPGTAFDNNQPISPRNQVALSFAEQYVMDPSGMTDQQAAALNELFTEPELTALTFCVAVYDALARVRLVLELDGALVP
jgi:alkylhydroperoxidase family enzyme